MKITMIGAGYVGLVSGVCFSDFGHDVVCVEKNPEAYFDVASNPEFLREGAAIDDFMRPDRVVVGVETAHASEVMQAIYRPLYLRDFPIMTTGLESAEMIKYATHAFRALDLPRLAKMMRNPTLANL